jgi:hypothetical protein
VLCDCEAGSCLDELVTFGAQGLHVGIAGDMFVDRFPRLRRLAPEMVLSKQKRLHQVKQRTSFCIVLAVRSQFASGI